MTNGEWHRSEAGQTTALVVAMLFTLAMFVALVVDVGQMVNRRVALQLVADAGAWSGATVQAVQLNHFAYWSRFAQNAYKNASGLSLGFRFGECVSSQVAARLVDYAAGGMALAGLVQFPNKAYQEARRHSLFNIDDLFPGERDNFDFSTMAGPSDGSVFAPVNGNIAVVPLRRGDRLYTGDHPWRRETLLQIPVELSVKVSGRLPWARSTASGRSESWTCYTFPTTVSRVTISSPAGYKLQRLGQPYLFVWRVKEKRPTRALFFDRFFGPNAVPAMTAVAVAKAVGGSVHEGRSRYRAKMVPVSRYSLVRGVIRDPLARPGRFPPGSGLGPFRSIVH